MAATYPEPIPPEPEWLARCAAHLRRRFPTLAQEDLDDTAHELWTNARWRTMQSEHATVEWLRLGAITS